MRIDINCDMGEGMLNDELLMPFITSANIACGYHAGGEAIIRRTIDLAIAHGVKIGAHPSFKDKKNFGRTEMQLPPDEIYALIIQQLVKIDLIAREKGVELHHVKPHGALYNMAAKDAMIARQIVTAIKDFREDLILYGQSGSFLVSEAKSAGVKSLNEVFADRTYQDDGSLTPRSFDNALIEDVDDCVKQVMEMVQKGQVTTVTGKKIPVNADTICIHGDSRKAVFFAKAIFQLLKKDLKEVF